MDYEYYAVDPYDPLDPKTDMNTYREALCLYDEGIRHLIARVRIKAFFSPHFKIGPLDAFMLGRDLLVKCEQKEDIESTLLRNPKR